MTAGELLDRADVDTSGGVSLPELKRLFDLVEADLSAEVIADSLDADRSGELDERELRPLLSLFARQNIAPPTAARRTDDAPGQGFDRLYRDGLRDGPRDERPSGAATGPPRIAAPVSHFRRLDLGDDGFIDADDLKALMSPARVDVRVAAILSALDRDGDQRLSSTEFRAALTSR